MDHTGEKRRPDQEDFCDGRELVTGTGSPRLLMGTSVSFLPNTPPAGRFAVAASRRLETGKPDACSSKQPGATSIRRALRRRRRRSWCVFPKTFATSPGRHKPGSVVVIAPWSLE